jgi:putative lipoprotein
MKLAAQSAPYGLALLLLGALPGCGGDAPAVGGGGAADMARIEGIVFYRERMLLPPGAEVEVQLQDVSRADAMATILASVLLTPSSGPPYKYAIDYDPGSIAARNRYALRATITHGDQLLFSSTDYIDPFSGNPVEIMVRRVPEPVQRDAPALEGTTWVLQTLAGEPAPPGAQGRPLDLAFSAQEQRAAGFSGCNRYTGGYAREGVAQTGSPLTFSPMAGTLMACADGGEVEHRYLQLLGSVTAFRLDGDTLSLLAGPEVVATFRSS